MDGAVSALDLTSRSGYRAFLRAQAGALDAIAPTCARLTELPSLSRLRPLLTLDMATIGAAPAPRLDAPVGLHPMGAYYVVAGSRLGAQVLARRVAESGDKTVRAATRYLADRRALDAWRAWLAASEAVTENADAIVEGAEATFALYERALAAVLEEVPEHA
ncbi:biliverdin-producing heme oxygenase [Pontivivens ytuae]|uniref:Biliverdin-producing heme oxygenase n=1 Tax=Pontivivens ytuae TaxID=2789856 RepID=A0A7S9QB06_9RHOB|nr:biliverdin-producing heme oxygenase [Pontivivens ytuae]QPH52358.1 biliverdin-producing heme oxygenase [Pontivivens ytuae]